MKYAAILNGCFLLGQALLGLTIMGQAYGQGGDCRINHSDSFSEIASHLNDLNRQIERRTPDFQRVGGDKYNFQYNTNQLQSGAVALGGGKILSKREYQKLYKNHDSFGVVAHTLSDLFNKEDFDQVVLTKQAYILNNGVKPSDFGEGVDIYANPLFRQINGIEMEQFSSGISLRPNGEKAYQYVAQTKIPSYPSTVSVSVHQKIYKNKVKPGDAEFFKTLTSPKVTGKEITPDLIFYTVNNDIKAAKHSRPGRDEVASLEDHPVAVSTLSVTFAWDLGSGQTEVMTMQVAKGKKDIKQKLLKGGLKFINSFKSKANQIDEIGLYINGTKSGIGKLQYYFDLVTPQ